MKEKKKKIPAFRSNLYFLKMIWKISPGRVIGEFGIALYRYAEWAFFTVVFMRYLFGSEEINRSFGEVMTFIWVAVAVFAVACVFQFWYYYVYQAKSSIKIYYELNRMLFEKACSVDVSCYETPEFYSQYTKATTEAFDRALGMMEHLAGLVSATLSSVYVIATMASITWWTFLFVLFPLVANMIFGKMTNTMYFDREQEKVPYSRRYDYVNRVMYLQKYAGEVRMTRLFSILKKTYTEAYHGIIKVIRSFSPRLFFISCIKLICMYPLAFQGMWFVAAYLAIVQKSISLGDFVVLSSAVVSITYMVGNVSSSVLDIGKDGLFIENLKTFLNYQPKLNENQKGILPELPVQTLELRDVSFRYEGQEKDALQHISMTLNSGEKVALVGLNGSGKSTLVKLIMRLYDPTEGQILLNGVDIREYDLREYRRLIGATFQDFAMFSASVLENVVMNRIEDEETRKAAISALKESGVWEKIETLKNGEDTVLTREFDDEGAVLSGGENQKIAIARAFAKASPIVILDEPSSALDPIAEYNMYETIMRLCSECDLKKGKIAVIISHRLSSAAMSDKVYVLENTRLIEWGSHEELLRRNGKYAEMFKKQAENYLTSIPFPESGVTSDV